MQNVNLIVALQLAFCSSILAVIALTLCNTDLMINAFVHCCFISNVVQNVNFIVAMHSALCASRFAVIALTLCNIDVKIPFI